MALADYLSLSLEQRLMFLTPKHFLLEYAVHCLFLCNGKAGPTGRGNETVADLYGIV